MSYFSNLLTSIFEKKSYLKNFIVGFEKTKKENLLEITDLILQNKSEASSIIYSKTFFDVYNKLTETKKKKFFLDLLTNYNIEIDMLNKYVVNYKRNNSLDDFKNITILSEPKWIELFKKLNTAPGATFNLVKMREALLKFVKGNEELKKIDIGFQKLFQNWFNPGFLVLQPIDWNTPANILEKIIQYEAVHEISSWDDLRARLEPKDRKCFAFFHPAIYEEPLIFVEIALMKEIPNKISSILKNKRVEIDPNECNSAIFYSISNCQPGLKGVTFGNFLLKNVAEELNKNFPSLQNFSTLSPVPSFYKWVTESDTKLNKDLPLEEILNFVKNNNNYLTEKIFSYLTVSNRKDRSANDPVSRFHLGNGAILERINYLGDESLSSLKNSLGFMVNYKYELKKLEKNHEEYNSRKKIIYNNEIKKNLKNI